MIVDTKDGAYREASVLDLINPICIEGANTASINSVQIIGSKPPAGNIALTGSISTINTADINAEPITLLVSSGVKVKQESTATKESPKSTNENQMIPST